MFSKTTPAKTAPPEPPPVIDDYDPHLFREVKKPISNIEAFINLLKCSLGTGCLALPLGFYHSGWLNGLIGCVYIAVLVMYTVHILIGDMYLLCRIHRVPLLTYPQAMEYGMLQGPTGFHILSKPAKIMVDFFLGIYQFGTLAVYVVFIAASIKAFCEAQGVRGHLNIYMMALILPLCLIYFIRDLKYLAPFSAVANLLLLLGYAFVLHYAFKDLPPLSQRVAFNHIKHYPMFFGTLLFALYCIGVIIAIEAEMKKPKDYLGYFGVLNAGITFVATLYAGFGFLGYWKYGDVLKGSISLNIPQDTFSLVTKLMFAVAIYISYSLQGYIVMDVVWSHYLKSRVPQNRQLLVELIVRAIIVLLSVLVGMFCGKLGPMVSLFGALCLSILGLCFPAVLNTCMRYHTGYGYAYLYLVRNVVIFLFGLLGAISGTWFSIDELIH